MAGPRGSSSKKLSAKKKGKTPKGPAGRLTAGVKRTLWGDEEADSSASSGPSKKSTKRESENVKYPHGITGNAAGCYRSHEIPCH